MKHDLPGNAGLPLGGNESPRVRIAVVSRKVAAADLDANPVVLLEQEARRPKLDLDPEGRLGCR